MLVDYGGYSESYGCTVWLCDVYKQSYCVNSSIMS